MQLAGVVSDHAYRIPAFPSQGIGHDVFVDVSAEEPVAFALHALDLPFTDKGIQACRLKGSTTALGQSVVRRHTCDLLIVVVIIVVVVVVEFQQDNHLLIHAIEIKMHTIV